MNVARTVLVSLLSADDELALLTGDVDLVLPKPGNRKIDAEAAKVEANEVERLLIILPDVRERPRNR